MVDESHREMTEDFARLQTIIHCNAVNKGFWERNGKTQDPFDPDVVAGKLALIHSEVSEALESIRNGNPESDHLKGVDGFSEEAGDAIVRILDLCEARGINLIDVILKKVDYNLRREHMHGGKTL